MLLDGLTVDVCRGTGGMLFVGATVAGCFGGKLDCGLIDAAGVADASGFEVLGAVLIASGANTSTLKSNVRRSAPCIAPIPMI